MGVLMGVLDHRRQPKPAWAALIDACRDLIVVSDPLPDPIHPGDRLNLAVHVVSQLRQPIKDAVVTARLTTATGEEATRRKNDRDEEATNEKTAARRWTGDIAADTCTFIGRITTTAPPAPGPLTLELKLAYKAADNEPVTVANRYQATISTAG